MPFCIPEEEYDEELHEIVSGPHDTCTGCNPLPSERFGDFFEISVTDGNDPSLQQVMIVRIEDSELAATADFMMQAENVYISGRIFSGTQTYNSSWPFYMDPSSVSLVVENNVPQQNKDVGLVQLKESIESNSIEDGSEFHFKFSRKSRLMDVKGVTYCYDPLIWTPFLALDDSSQVYVQVASCEGDCQNKYEDEFLGACDDFVDQNIQAIEDAAKD